MSDIGNMIGRALAVYFVIAIVLAAVGAIALWEGIPWLWRLLKPWLHQVTG